MDKQLEYSISTWAGIKWLFPLIDQPNIKQCCLQLFLSFAQQKVTIVLILKSVITTTSSDTIY